MKDHEVREAFLPLVAFDILTLRDTSLSDFGPDSHR
jgi:hypothetical protein